MTEEQWPVPEPISVSVQDYEYDPTRQSIRTLTGLIAARNAEQVAESALSIDQHWPPGYCLIFARTRALIPSRWPDATTAWFNTERKHENRQVPRGAFAFWTGGSEGHGHIAVGLGGGWIRSTDANGPGSVYTRHLDWFDQNWPSLNYVGWTDNVNGYTVPGVVEEEEEMKQEDFERIREIIRDEVDRRFDEYEAQKIRVRTPSGETREVTRNTIDKETWQKVARLP